MAKTRKKLPEKIRAKLQQEIGSECPVCRDSDVGHFEVHHLDENPENNDFLNLLMLCRNCHSNITKGDLTLDEAKAIKKILSIRNSKSKGSSIHVAGNVSNSTLANSIQTEKLIITHPKKPKIEPAIGTIARNAEKKNYVKHLIDRYNEFKESEIGKSKMNYAVIYSIIKKEFKASAFQIPEQQFDSLTRFLQKRIDGTRLGKINTSKGIKNYSKFSE